MKKIICLFLCIITLFTLSACNFTNNGNNELVIQIDGNSQFKMAQFADLHFGQEGSKYHNADEKRTIDFMDYFVETQKPDFIVLSGDNIMNSGVAGAEKLINIMDKYKTPYTFVFGNHDAESSWSTFTKHAVSNYLESCTSPYLLYKSGYIETTSENRYGNFSISLKDKSSGDLLGAIVIIDTGVYDYSLSAYQSITQGQIDWYKTEMAKLNNIYAKQNNNKHEVIPSITFGHIQLPEHFSAYKKAIEHDNAEFVYFQELGNWINNLVNNESNEDSPFYSAMKEIKSSKAYFCGHMHSLAYHIKTDDIILGFCPQMCVTSNDTTKKFGTFLYSFDSSFEINYKFVDEP